MALPPIPNGWTTRGDLPDVDPRVANDEQLQELDEDLLQLAHVTGEFTLDIGWYPTASRTGHYVCRAIASQDWAAPLDELATTDRAEVVEWINRWFADVQQILGDEGQLSDQPVASILVSVVVEIQAEDERTSMGPLVDTASTASVIRSRPERVPEYAS